MGGRRIPTTALHQSISIPFTIIILPNVLHLLSIVSSVCRHLISRILANHMTNDHQPSATNKILTKRKLIKFPQILFETDFSKRQRKGIVRFCRRTPSKALWYRNFEDSCTQRKGNGVQTTYQNLRQCCSSLGRNDLVGQGKRNAHRSCQPTCSNSIPSPHQHIPIFPIPDPIQVNNRPIFFKDVFIKSFNFRGKHSLKIL